MENFHKLLMLIIYMVKDAQYVQITILLVLKNLLKEQ